MIDQNCYKLEQSGDGTHRVVFDTNHPEIAGLFPRAVREKRGKSEIEDFLTEEIKSMLALLYELDDKLIWTSEPAIKFNFDKNRLDECSAVVETTPEIALPDLSREHFSIVSEDIDEDKVEYMKREYLGLESKLVTLELTPLQSTQYAEVELEMADPSHPEHFKKRLFLQIGSNDLPLEIQQEMIGMLPGRSISGSFKTMGENLGYRLKLLKIQEKRFTQKITPEALRKRGFSSLPEFNHYIKSEVKSTARMQRRRDLFKSVFARIVDNAKMEIPPNFLKLCQDQMQREFESPLNDYVQTEANFQARFAIVLKHLKKKYNTLSYQKEFNKIINEEPTDFTRRFTADFPLQQKVLAKAHSYIILEKLCREAGSIHVVLTNKTVKIEPYNFDEYLDLNSSSDLRKTLFHSLADPPAELGR